MTHGPNTSFCNQSFVESQSHIFINILSMVAFIHISELNSCHRNRVTHKTKICTIWSFKNKFADS